MRTAAALGVASIAVLLGAMTFALPDAPSQAHETLTWRQAEILHVRARTHACTDTLGRRRFRVEQRIIVGGPAYRRWVLELWRQRARLYCKAAADYQRQPRGVATAWTWYASADTQCVVSHEGGWTSTSINPPGVYAGRFQMDSSFERETEFGAKMQDRYGRAWNWPPWAQVFHAYEVWSYAGWSRWPTYARYCA